MYSSSIESHYRDEFPFLELGFTKEEYGDKNHHLDPFDTLFFRTWKRDLHQELVVEVNYSFEVSYGQTKKLIGHSVELVASGSSIALNVHSMDDIGKLIDLFTQLIPS
jgi:hypothetical protein